MAHIYKALKGGWTIMSKDKNKNKNNNVKKTITVNRIKELNIADYCKDVIKMYGANINLARIVPDALDGLVK